MSIPNLSNYKSNRYNSTYLKLLPVAIRERPPQAKEFEDIQDIVINPINNYTNSNFNTYEVLSGLKVISFTPSTSITLSSARILLNNYPIIIETDQVTITATSSSYIIYLQVNITKQDNKYIYSYSFNTNSIGYPLLQINNTSINLLTKSLSNDYVRQAMYEIYGNFISRGLVYTNSCITPGIAYIKGERVNFPYHTAINSNLTNYRVIIQNKAITTLPIQVQLDPNNMLDLGVYKNNKWHPNLYNKQIKNNDINYLEKGLDGIRDYLLETALLKPIDTTSNLITDSFNNKNNADTSSILFDCDLEQGALIINKFSRITRDVSINNGTTTNTKIVNNSPNIIIQNYTKTPLISQLTSDSFISTSISTRGVLKLGPIKLDTSIYKTTSDVTTLLTQTIINAEVYGLTANSSNFTLTIGSKLISTIITTDNVGFAKFSFSLPTGSSINDIITIQNSTSSATSSLQDTTYSVDNTYVGQTFNIDTDNTTIVEGSIYIRKVTTANPLIKVLITKYVNNQPQEVIGQSIINNNNIKTSDTGLVSTDFVFDFPITLSKGQYALVITSVNSSIDLFISNTSTLTNSNLFSYTNNQIQERRATGLIYPPPIEGNTNLPERRATGLIFPLPIEITSFLNKDLKFVLYKPIYTTTKAPITITVKDNIDKFDTIYYPGKFRINNIEYTNFAPVNLTNEANITLDINKYSIVNPILISTNKTKSTYISKTIRTNFSYSNVYLELDAIILDATSVMVYISSNEGYTWEELTIPIKYLIDGNDNTYKYIYNKDLTPLTRIINSISNTTQATRNYLTIRIDLATQSDNKPIVKGYKCYVR
jgi:hypothetical protein